MTKPEPARYRTTNWKSCNDALKQRGSLLIWLDKDMTWLAAKAGRNGRPPVFSDAAIQFCLMVKVLFGVPLRQTTGMVASILSMARLDWPVPDFSTVSRRQKRITVQVSSRRAPGPLNLLVDTEPWRRHWFEAQGEGDQVPRRRGMACAQACTQRRRQYRKVHLAMDTATGDIRAVEFTSSDKGDSPVLPHLLDQIPPDEQIGTVTGDDAFDTRRCHSAILGRGGTAIIPRRKNGRRWREDCPAAKARNEILKATQRLGSIRRTYAAPLAPRFLLILETLVRISRPKQDRGKDEMPQGLRGTHRLTRSRPPESRSPDPRGTHEPLQCNRHRRDRTRGLNPTGKGGVRPPPDFCNNADLTQAEDAIVVAFRRHTLLPLDDCLYALKPSIPHLTRSALHRRLQRHGISHLPDVEDDKPKRSRLNRYPIGFFHIDIARCKPLKVNCICSLVSTGRASSP